MGDEGKLYVPQELISVYCERARQAYLIGNKALAKELNAKGQVHNMHMKAAHGKAQESIYRQRIQSEDDGRKACNFLHEAGPSKVYLYICPCKSSYLDKCYNYAYFIIYGIVQFLISLIVMYV